MDFLAGLGLLEEVALVVFLVAGSVSVVFLEGGDERATMIRFGWEAVVDTFSVFFSPNHDVGLPSGNRLDALPERFLVNGILVISLEKLLMASVKGKCPHLAWVGNRVKGRGKV